MTVYVDRIMPRRPKDRRALRWGIEWCHLFADDEEELHSFAESLGLKRSYFQSHIIPHYDLTPPKRHEAIKKGAVKIATREYVLKYRKDQIQPDWARTE